MAETADVVLHWRETGFCRVMHVTGRPPTITLPMPYLEASAVGVEGDTPLGLGQIEWTFQLVGEDDHGVLHYDSIEPPWTAQIRSAMAQARQLAEREMVQAQTPVVNEDGE